MGKGRGMGRVLVRVGAGLVDDVGLDRRRLQLDTCGMDEYADQLEKSTSRLDDASDCRR